MLMTSDRYILLNRNGSANLLEGSSRNFTPLTTFHEIKWADRWMPIIPYSLLIITMCRLQNNLAHLPTQVRVSTSSRTTNDSVWLIYAFFVISSWSSSAMSVS